MNEAKEQKSAKILTLNVENTLGVKAALIDADGNHVTISGPNEAGKSSILAAIEGFRGKRFRPTDWVHHGAEKSVVKMETDKWWAKLTVTAKSERLEVGAPGNTQTYASPQAILDAWFGDVTFDPMEFKRLPAKDQLSTVQKLSWLDLTQINQEIDAIFAERTQAGRSLKEAEHAAMQARRDDWPAQIPEQEIELSSIMTELEECDEIERGYRQAFQERERMETIGQDLDDSIQEWQAEIARLQEKIQAAQAKKADVAARLEALPIPQDTFSERRAALKAKAASVDQTNEWVRKWRYHQQAEARLADAKGKFEGLSANIEEARQRKLNMIANAKYPIAGLGINEESGVATYRGVPIKQLSEAESIRVSCAIAMSLNPALKTILIRNGSLLDSKSRQVIYEMAEKRGYQVWMEVVHEAKPGEAVPGFYIEHGMLEVKES